MSLATAIATARATMQNAMEDAFAGTITIGADDYECAVARGRIEREPMDNGTWKKVERRVFHVRKSLMATLPALNARIESDGNEYRLTAYGADHQGAVAWTLYAQRDV